MCRKKIFPGFWYIKFDPKLKHKYILEKTAFFLNRIKELAGSRCRTYIIEYNTCTAENTFSVSQDQLCAVFSINLNNLPESFLKREYQGETLPDTPLLPSITEVQLVYPVFSGDSRWDSINLTTSSIYLGSELEKESFKVKAQKIRLPLSSFDNLRESEALGFTLFEDTLKESSELLDKLKEESSSLLLGGGPLITLNPIESLFHLENINVLIRGEAEKILPQILKLRASPLKISEKFKGVSVKTEGHLIMSDFEENNLVHNFSEHALSLDFINKEHLVHGIELNLSRGCRRSCVFCSKMQGREYRTINTDTAEHMFRKIRDKLDLFELKSKEARSVNINDDDILQEPEFAEKIFNSLKTHSFSLWGIQTSVASFLDKDLNIKKSLIELIDSEELYCNRKLLWIGTDTFLKTRGRRLGKKIPDTDTIQKLVAEFEKRDIDNYHYWISSDYNSDWAEFFEEVSLICKFMKKYKNFNLLAHAPFTVPYSTTPLYKLLISDENLKKQIIYRDILKGGKSDIFTLNLTKRTDTRYNSLNSLLKNQSKSGNNRGFFDYLKENDYFNVFLTMYNFIKEERIITENSGNYKEAVKLRETENKISDYLSSDL